MKINLNKDWDFYFDKDKSDKETVTLPHTVKETPFNAFSEEIYQTVCKYEKKLELPKEAEGKRIILHVEGAAHRATLFVNGKEMYTHKCGYTGFEVDITNELLGTGLGVQNSNENPVITIILDTRETLNQPPFGNVIDYMTYGGLYRDVWVDIRPQVYIKRIFHNYIEDSNNGVNGKIADDNALESKIVIGGDAKEVDITQEIEDSDGKEVAKLSMRAKVRDGLEGREAVIKMPVQVIEKWSPNKPVLYRVNTVITPADAGESDKHSEAIGFRHVEWKEDGFYLNDEKIKIRGINRHQSYPYVGYAMPESIQKEDALIIKKELGLNAVRTSHYPQSKYFIEECDRLGILVFTEIPGWQYIGDDEWKDQAVQNTKDMVIQYRNHPSIVLWGVRINESQDDNKLYKRTNKAAKELAPGIFTGGVRFIRKSSLLEDVYTYNDFIHTGDNEGVVKKDIVTPDLKKGYLVTEYCGHMFPTKPYDDESHRIEHALRHAKILNDVYAQEDVAGSFGWCMFDYNTHKDFGSGDRVCYHGLMDMYRNPKYAAGLYKSQSDEKPVLEVLSDMNIGEYPACNLRKVVCFTNTDGVRMFKNGIFVKEFLPDEEKYGSLPHPPVIVDDFVGELLISQEGFSEKKSKDTKKMFKYMENCFNNEIPKRAFLIMCKLMLVHHLMPKKVKELFGKYASGWGDSVREYEFAGIKRGEEIIRVKRHPSNGVTLDVKYLKTELKSQNGYDAASVRIRAVNQNGATESYVNEAVFLEATGSIEIIGPKVAILRGGMGGTYVKSSGSGEGTLTLEFRGQKTEIKYTTCCG